MYEKKQILKQKYWNCSKGLFQRNYLPCLASRNLWLEKLLVVLVECVIRVWSCSCCRRRYFCMATQRSCFLCQFGPPPSAMMITPLERGDASQKAAQTPFSVRLVSTVGKNFDFFSWKVWITRGIGSYIASFIDDWYKHETKLHGFDQCAWEGERALWRGTTCSLFCRHRFEGRGGCARAERAHYCNYKHSNTTIYTAGLLLTVTRNERSTHEHKMCTTLRPRCIETGRFTLKEWRFFLSCFIEMKCDIFWVICGIWMGTNRETGRWI